MNLHARLFAWQRRRLGSVERFPFGAPGDPTLTMLPPYHEAIAVRSVVGSVDRHTQLDREFRPFGGSSFRLRAITNAMKQGAHFPPIQVYRLSGVCYVIDGHHRVAAALETGQIYLDAMVTECMPHAEAADHGLQEARVRFGLRTGLRALAFSAPTRYQQALAQIQEHRWYLGERGQRVDLHEAAQAWYEQIYLPVIRQAITERVAPVREAQEAGEFYLELCDLKYSVSSERGHDIGFAQAIREWAGRQERRSPLGLLSRFFGLTVLV